MAPSGDVALGYGGAVSHARRLVDLGQMVVTVLLTDFVEPSLTGERLLRTEIAQAGR